MIIIAPWSKPLRNAQPNPKNYPLWSEVVAQLPGKIIQVGTAGEQALVDDFRANLSLADLKQLVLECSTWVSVDTFFQHWAWSLNKPGVVVWGQSDPNIYGHPENINLLKSREYLTPNQFLFWEQIPYRDDCWVAPDVVAKAVLGYLEPK
jgi:hypothetical protein